MRLAPLGRLSPALTVSWGFGLGHSMCPAGAHTRLTGVIAVLCMRTPALQTSQCMDSADQSVGAAVVSGPQSVECHSTLPLSRLVIFLSWARVLFLTSIADQVPWWSDHEESPWHPLAFMGGLSAVEAAADGIQSRGKSTKGCRSPIKMASWAAPTGGSHAWAAHEAWLHLLSTHLSRVFPGRVPASAETRQMPP